MIDWSVEREVLANSWKKYVDGALSVHWALGYLRAPAYVWENVKGAANQLESFDDQDSSGSGMTFLLAAVLWLTTCVLLFDLFILQRFIPSACYNCVTDLTSLPGHLFSTWMLLFALYKAVRTFHMVDTSSTEERIEQQGDGDSDSIRGYTYLRILLGRTKQYILHAFPVIILIFLCGGRLIAGGNESLDSSAVMSLAIYGSTGLFAVVITVSLFLET